MTKERKDTLTNSVKRKGAEGFNSNIETVEVDITKT